MIQMKEYIYNLNIIFNFKNNYSNKMLNFSDKKKIIFIKKLNLNLFDVYDQILLKHFIFNQNN
jgi:hypothetical protein